MGNKQGVGGGVLLPIKLCTNNRRLVAEVLQDNRQYTRGPPAENPTCAAFKEYEDVPETVPLNFVEDDVMWVASNLSGAVGALGLEAIGMCNWLICFGCVSEELRVVVTRMSDWTVNSSPP